MPSRVGAPGAHSADRGEWYELDNAATLFPAVASDRTTTLFRISATLKQPLNVSALQRALANIAPRFPYFCVKLKAGFFWHYLSKTDETPRLLPDTRWPCMTPPSRMAGGFLFRVRVFGRRVAVEFSHIITDGTGAMTFLRALLLEYFSLLGFEVRDSGEIFRKEDQVDPEEFEDAYRRYFAEDVPSPERQKRAFRLPYPLLPVGVYKIVTGIVPVGLLSRAAKERGVSITVFLSGILMKVLYEIYRELPAAKRRRAGKFIRLEVPVNLRKIYATKTMRNFSLFVMPGIDLRLGSYDLEEILRLVHHYMEVSVDGRFINQQIARNMRARLHPFVRAVPLVLKRLALPHIYFAEGEALVSSVVTNLGVATMPEPLADYVERFDFVPAPSKWGKTGCAVVSYRDKASITFGRMAREAEVERRFFTTLIQLGIPVRIKAN